MEECRSPFDGVILDPDGKPQCCRKPKEGEIQPFAEVMSEAWKNSVYRQELLTFPEGQATDWIWCMPKRAGMLQRTLKALDKFNVPLGPDEIPIVLSNMQFERGVYRMFDANERVLRLPDKPLNLTQQLQNDSFFTAYVINSHICGM